MSSTVGPSNATAAAVVSVRAADDVSNTVDDDDDDVDSKVGTGVCDAACEVEPRTVGANDDANAVDFSTTAVDC